MIRWFSQAWTTVAVRRHVRRALVLLVLNLSATFAAALEVVHPAPESAGDTRFEYYWQLLARALTITEPDFGPYVLRSATSAMTERRALEELMTGSGKITVLVHGNVADYEKQLLPVYFPLDKGLLGYRVFLIRSETQASVGVRQWSRRSTTAQHRSGVELGRRHHSAECWPDRSGRHEL